MSALLAPNSSRHDTVQVPILWAAVVASLLLHAAALLGWLPLIHITPFEDPLSGKKSGTLAVRIAPPPSRPQSVEPPAPTPTPPAPKAKPAQGTRSVAIPAPPKPAPSSRVLALESPATASPPVAPPAEPAKPPAEDLSAMIAARRRARGEPVAVAPQPPAETEQERHNRQVTENLGLNRTPTFGTNRDRGGGVFQVRSRSLDYADFAFFGWNKAVGRNTLQRIEVPRGNNPNIETAVVKRIIEIIRDHATGNFEWESPRSGKYVTLSARIQDNAELEAFMMREFFPEMRTR